MVKNLSEFSRSRLAGVVDPVGRALVRAGVSADLVTVLGAVGVLIGCFFVVRGQLLAALLIITGSMLTDMLDGAIARASGRTTRFGAFLDSTMDRVADGAVFGSLAYWLAVSGHRVAFAAALVCLVTGQLVSYAKARAQGLGISCDVGIAERTERLILLMLGGIAWLLGVPYAFEVALSLLAALSLVTVVQRVLHVRRASRATAAAPEAGQP
ncbi:MAG: phosphatidylinositol phosphate synthase [Micromonosporaceae bacterium]